MAGREKHPIGDLPQPLADPLLRMKPWIKGLAWISLAAGLLLVLLFLVREDGRYLYMAGFQLAGAGLMAVIILLALPRQHPGIFYLRSFRKDSESYRIRDMIEVALGTAKRLAGIRDPSRRMPMMLRPVLLTVMMLQYAGARYLNLEAGADWKARLWRSLKLADGAIIDLRDTTPFVREEVELALETLGPERILYITGDDGDLGALTAGQAPHHLKWGAEDRRDPTAFISTVSAFARSLRDLPDIDPQSGFHQVAENVMSRASRIRNLVLAWVQIGIGAAFVFWFAWSGKADSPLVLVVLSVLLTLLVLLLLIRAIWGKAVRLGTARRHNREYARRLGRELAAAVLASAVLIGGFGIAGFVTYQAYSALVERARIAGEQAMLFEIRQGLERYRLDVQHYPPLSGDLTPLLEPPDNPSTARWDGPYYFGPPTDRWGTPYYYISPFDPEARGSGVGSAGPDREAFTDDDIFFECCRL